MNLKKYRFISDVKINDPEYKLKSQQLDYFTESKILDVANLYQKETDWHNTIPKEFDHE